MMPKEKAENLISQFKKYAYYPETKVDEIFVNELNRNAKQCALIAVDEIILYAQLEAAEKWWKEVKKELEKL